MDVIAVGDTSTGQVREINQDAYLVGDTVFAVADGMGGHLAGEVASATALGPLQDLDGRVFGSPSEAAQRLGQAVQEANARVGSASEQHRELAGMGTTLTAVMFEGRRLHVAHVGDSRAYLLRDGEVHQLTKDHTFVQQLLDDGSITGEEAATHPHRSVVTRAIGAADDVEADLLSVEIQPGDRVLICSDGLSGVVAPGTLRDLLRAERPPREIVTSLIGAADSAGSPDNVTAVVVDVAETAATSATPARKPVVIRPDADARELGPLPGPGPDDGLVPDRRARRRRMMSLLLGVAVVVGLFVGGGRWLLSRSYFVGVDDGRVAIFQGIPVSVGPLDLGWLDTETSLQLEDVAPFARDRVVDGIAAVDREDARRLVNRLREEGRDVDAPADDTDEGTGTQVGGDTP